MVSSKEKRALFSLSKALIGFDSLWKENKEPFVRLGYTDKDYQDLVTSLTKFQKVFKELTQEGMNDEESR